MVGKLEPPPRLPVLPDVIERTALAGYLRQLDLWVQRARDNMGGAVPSGDRLDRLEAQVKAMMGRPANYPEDIDLQELGDVPDYAGFSSGDVLKLNVSKEPTWGVSAAGSGFPDLCILAGRTRSAPNIASQMTLTQNVLGTWADVTHLGEAGGITATVSNTTPLVLRGHGKTIGETAPWTIIFEVHTSFIETDSFTELGSFLRNTTNSRVIAFKYITRNATSDRCVWAGEQFTDVSKFSASITGKFFDVSAPMGWTSSLIALVNDSTDIIGAIFDPRSLEWHQVFSDNLAGFVESSGSIDQFYFHCTPRSATTSKALWTHYEEVAGSSVITIRDELP